MALIKNNSVILSNVTSSTTSSAVSVADAYMADVYAVVSHSGSVTTAGSIQLQYSPDSGNTYYNGPLLFGGINALSYYWVISVPSDATHIKLAFAQATGASSSCSAQLAKITSL